MAKDEKHAPPKAGKSDTAHAVAKAGLSAIPLVGGPAAELFNMIVVPPLERRRVEWMEEVAEALRSLEGQGRVNLEDLAQDKGFVSTVMQATQAALRTHVREKREALRNAVLNATLPGAPGEALQAVFLSLVDSFTEWHLRLLKLFQAPPPLDVTLMGSLSQVAETAYPEIKGKDAFRDLVWKDLFERRLVSTDHLHTSMSASSLKAKRTTDLGDEFIAFISSPETQESGQANTGVS